MKVLFLTNFIPYPIDSGAAIYTYTTLKALQEMGCEVDLYCFCDDKEPDPGALQDIVRNVVTVRHNIITAKHRLQMAFKLILSLFQAKPFTVFKFASRKMRHLLAEQLQTESYDLIVMGHLNLCVYYALARKYASHSPILLTEHNCEYRIFETRADEEDSYIKRCVYRLEAKKLKKYESMMIKKVDYTTVLTCEDEGNLQSAVGYAFPHAVIPVGIPDHKIKKVRMRAPSDTIRLLFVGTLTWAPNDAGICWFIENVMGELSAKYKVELAIVGKNPSRELQSKASYFENVSLKGYVEDLDGVFNVNDIFIAPIFTGSGQKVKVMEAFSRGCPVIATSFAAVGISHEDGVNILIADTPEEFVTAVGKLTEENLYKRIAVNCRKTYEEEFSDGVVKEKIKGVVRKLTWGAQDE